MIRSLLASALSRAHVVASAVDDAIVRAWMALTGSPPLTRETLAQALGVRVVEDAGVETQTSTKPGPVHFRLSRYVPAFCGDVDGRAWSDDASVVVRAGLVACPKCKDGAADLLMRRCAS